MLFMWYLNKIEQLAESCVLRYFNNDGEVVEEEDDSFCYYECRWWGLYGALDIYIYNIYDDGNSVCEMSDVYDHLCSVLLYDDNDDNTLNANCDPDMRPASGWRGSWESFPYVGDARRQGGAEDDDDGFVWSECDDDNHIDDNDDDNDGNDHLDVDDSDEQQGIAAPVVNSETGLTTRQFAGDNDYNYNDTNDIDNDLNDNDTDLNDDNNDLVDNDNNNN